MIIPEIKLWRAVILQAASDARRNDTKNGAGVERIYSWSKSRNCRVVCNRANLDYDCIAAGFKKIYEDFINKKNMTV